MLQIILCFKFQVLGENKINTTVGGETYSLERN